MLNPEDRIDLITALTRLVDELCSPDLTIARSRVLRPELADLLERLHSSPKPPELADPGAGTTHTTDTVGQPVAPWDPVSAQVTPSVGHPFPSSPLTPARQIPEAVVAGPRRVMRAPRQCIWGTPARA